jgi:hypothetical protein
VAFVALVGLVTTSAASRADGPGAGYAPAGELRPRPAREITGSNWSIGAETMDRDFTVYENWKAYLGPLGVKKARLQSGWAKTEVERGRYRWEWLDAIVRDMVDQGVEPWICLGYGNPLYEGGGDTGLGGGWPRSEEALAAWDRYIAALVDRYQDRVDEWEIWNEPALRREDDAVGARSYADFLARTAAVVRRAQPGARILGLSLPGFPLEWAGHVFERLRERGRLDLVDEVTYHPYAYNPCAVYGSVAKLRDLVRSYAPEITLRQGENGAPSVPGGFGAIADFAWDEQRQAKWALRRLLGDLGRDIPSSYFSICDMKYPDRVNFKGLLAINPDKTVHHVKEAYRAVQHLTAVFDDRVRRIGDFAGRVEGDAPGLRYAIFGYRTARGGGIVTLWRGDAAPGVRPDRERVGVSLPGMTFQDPVWVDLRTGTVYAIAAALWSQEDDRATFAAVPVDDSPALIAERSALPLKP